MLISWSWLLEMCDLDRAPTVAEGAEALTRVGAEIETMTDLGAGFSGVVVAEVVGKQAHPDSNKLTLVDVITERGGAATTVVCGAPNVPEPGRKVLWAQIGAKLPGGITLAAKPVKGIVSPGMLCAEDELGLGDDHGGIVVLDAADPTALGAPAQRALGLEDWVLDVKAPANRGDLLGHLGVARELCAVLRGRLVLPDTDLSAWTSSGDAGLVEIEDAGLCARYTARRIDGVRVAPSPRRIAARLRAVGVRPISNVVDVTNYVMFELGQPLHAFDAATLASGEIRVGPAHDGESFSTLDKVERTLVPTDIVIRDGARGIALAGVMGGLDTEVTAGTTSVLLEAATFDPRAIRRTARRLGLHSEASHRFERIVDAELAPVASARAARLLCELAGGRAVSELVDRYPAPRPPAPISVRMARVAAIAGVAVDGRGLPARGSDAEGRRGSIDARGLPARGSEDDPVIDETSCSDALSRLGCAVEVASGRELTVTPPSARPDISREIDVIEEILRIVGYDVIPTTLPALRAAPPVREPDRGDLARQALAAAGASEAITYAFQSAERCHALGLPGTDRRAQPIAIRNPMSEAQAVMRTSLLPNLLAAVARNASHGRRDVNIFEVGNVFLRRGEAVSERPPHELADEPLWAAGVLSGARPAQLGQGAAWDAFDAKALALVAIRAVGGATLAVETVAVRVPYLHPGVAGELHVGREAVGWFGEVHPAVRSKLGVDAPVFAFEVALAHVPAAGAAQMRAIPRFPGTTRDISLLLPADVPAGRVQAAIAAVQEPLVASVQLVEDYRDAKLGEGRKSMLWSIAYRAPDRTLTDAEVDKAHEAIVGRLTDGLGAQRR